MRTLPGDLLADAAVTSTYLRERGGEASCYAISEQRALDGRLLSIDEALHFLASNRTYGTVLSIVPGELAYYHQGELDNLTWILESRG